MARGRSGGSILVVDVGTSSIRAAVVRPDATVEHEHRLATAPRLARPGVGRVRRRGDGRGRARGGDRSARGQGGPVAGVGIANQRASSIVWDRTSGKPLAPGIGWQDLRTVGTCLALQADGIRLAPNASATKVMAILDEVDPERGRARTPASCASARSTRGSPGRWREAPPPVPARCTSPMPPMPP